jgi:outer membrane receptor protein involved in Fe transport
LLHIGVMGAVGEPARDTADGDLFELSMDELMEITVVTASKKKESIDDAPNVMYVVSGEQIRRRGYRTLRDLLITIPGFGSFHRDLDFVSQVRGIAPNGHNKVTYMVNGHAINFLTETSMLNGPINLDQFERVEVIVGPGSVLYGPETLLATVNMITATPGENRVMATAGTDIYAATVIMSGKWGASRYLSGGITSFQRRGWDAWDDTERLYLAGSELTGRMYPSYFITASGRLDNLSFNAVFHNGDQPELNIEEQLRAKRIEDGEGHRYDYLDNIGAVYTREVLPGLTLSLSGSYDNKRYIRAHIYEGTMEAGSDIDNYDLSQKVYGVDLEAQYRLRRLFLQAGLQLKHKQNRHNYAFTWSSFDGEDPGHTVRVDTLVVFDTADGGGSPVARDTIVVFDTVLVGDTLAAIDPVVTHGTTNAYGGYLSCELAVLEELTVTAALRADYDEVIEGRPYLSPRLALVYRPFGFWTSKVMYNRATRMPDPWMSPLNPIWGTRSDPGSGRWANTNATRPEVLSAVEWQNIVYVGGVRLQVNAYYQRLEDFITWYRPFTNTGDFEGMGVEGGVSAHPVERLRLWANGAYTASRFTLTANPLPRGGPPLSGLNDRGEAVAVPLYTINGGSQIRIIDRLFLSLTARYFDRQPAFDNTRSAWGYVGPRWYLDGAVTWEPAVPRGLTISLAGRNLLDNQQPVSVQFRKDRYRPRGVSADLKVAYRW